MSINLQDNSTLSKPQTDAPVMPKITIEQALRVLESVASYCKDNGYKWRTINDAQDGVPVLVILIPRVIETRDERGIQRFLVVSPTTNAPKSE